MESGFFLAGTPAEGDPVVTPEALFTPREGPYWVWYAFIKRALDIVCSLIGLIVGTPLFILIAVAIKLDSKGSVIFKQTRLGRGGSPFAFYKFRSMRQGSETLQDDLRHLDITGGPVFKIPKDPRITRVGYFLRRTTLDELPQLWNVFKGEMSLVGPRPPIPAEVEKYTHLQRHRLDVKPGLTCLWQVSGRSEIPFHEWVQLDLYYIQHQSLLLDLKILVRTLPAVLSRRGAY